MEPVIKTKWQNFNVGMRFCIALSKEASKSSKPVGVSEAATQLLLSSDYDVWIKAAHISANCYNESQGLEPLGENEFMAIADSMGFKALAELIAEMWKTFEAVNTQPLREVEGEKKNQ
jgi:hypothetical protein